MKTKIKLLIALSFIFTSIANTVIAQTWSQGSNEVRTGVPSGGYGIGETPTNGSLLFYNSTNTNTVKIQSGTTSTTYTMTLPTAQGATATNTVLTNNGSGTLSWTSASSLVNIYEVSTTLTSTQISNLYTTPITIISAPGSGKYIEIISASAYLIFNGTTYTSGADHLYLSCVGASDPQAIHNAILDFGGGVSTGQLFTMYDAASSTQLIDNAALIIYADGNGGGNPSGGNSEIKVTIMYRIVTI